MSTVEEPEKKAKKRPAPVEVEAPAIVRRTLTVKEFAESIGLSRDSVYQMIADGQVSVIDNPTGGIRIRREEVEAYLKRNERRVKPGPSAAAPEARRPVAPPEASVAPDGKSRLRLPR